MSPEQSGNRDADDFFEGGAVPAYVIFNIVSVTDTERFAEYAKRTPPTIEAYGGRYVVRGGSLEVLEGSWTPSTLVVLEFPSMEQARGWYESEEYRPLKELRVGAGDVDGVVVEGVNV